MPKSKMENGYFVAKNFVWCVVLFCKIIGQNLKFFRWNEKLNTPIVSDDISATPLHYPTFLFFNRFWSPRQPTIACWGRPYINYTRTSGALLWFDEQKHICRDLKNSIHAG
jgi:hypothetical protein